MSGVYTWDLVMARIKARRDARAESGVDVANLDSVLEKMGRRDRDWFETDFTHPLAIPAEESAISCALTLVAEVERLHTLRPSLKARMLADEAARLAERVNAFVESESRSSTPFL
jgi:hypothetical protein